MLIFCEGIETLTARTFCFSDFELDGTRRVLLKQGAPVSLNPKAIDLLYVLVEAHGEVLTKDDLLERVWPGQYVEEGNLKVHISYLRKALGELKSDHRFIVTIPGRGYTFVADLNDHSNGDIVIERHSKSRILIDEQLLETNEAGLSSSRRRRNFIFAGLIVGAILLAAGSIGFLIARRASAPAPQGDLGGMQLKRLTTNGRVSFAALSPDGKLFAYAMKELEQNSLWMGFVEGGNDVQLIPSETGRYNDLAFSADGNSVLFTFSGADSRESVLYRMPASGGAREKIRGGIMSFGVSPDGNRYAFARNNSASKTRQIVVASFDSAEDQIAVDLPYERSIGSESISWSPDGNWIAFGASSEDGDAKDEVFIVKLSDNSLTRATRHGWKQVIKTTWTDAGLALLIVAEETDSNTSVSYSQIWRVGLPVGDVRQVTNDLSSYRSVLNAADETFLTVELRQTNNIWVAPAENLSAIRQVTFGTFGRYDGLWGLDWTRDGRIVFTSTDHRSQVISSMDADGGNIHQLTPPGYTDSFVNASNDGRYIVFQSTRAGGSDIWRMDLDGANVVRLTSEGKCDQPFVSPDSRFVYYKSKGGMRRISIEGGESESVIDMDVSYPSLSPDGQYIAAGTGSRLALFPATGGQPERYFEMTRFGTVSANTRWSPDGKSIAYRDRGYGYWLQPVAGGEPKRMDGLPMEKFYNFAWSKDGKRFAFIRGQEIRDVVLFRRSN